MTESLHLVFEIMLHSLQETLQYFLIRSFFFYKKILAVKDKLALDSVY